VTESSPQEWLTVPNLADILGKTVSQVRRLIEDRAVLGQRIDGVLHVPSSFIKDGEVMTELKGTIVVLGDAGFSDDEIIHWLLNSDDSLATEPIEALRAGRKAEVRRVAQSLGF
jgi:hypothetical protein